MYMLSRADTVNFYYRIFISVLIGGILKSTFIVLYE